MENIDYILDGNILTLKVDISKRLGRSSTGRTITVASSGGGQRIPGTDVTLNLNVWAKP